MILTLQFGWVLQFFTVYLYKLQNTQPQVNLVFKKQKRKKKHVEK